MSMDTDSVRDVIRDGVIDPELGINIVDLGLLYDVDIKGEKAVRLELTLTTMGCPLWDVIQADSERAVKERYGDDVNVEVEFVWDPPWNPEMMSEDARMELGIF
jgi:metal-sulfur cluster biosynthetic enzyme